MCKRNNIRMFELHQYEMSFSDLKGIIIETVLKIACHVLAKPGTVITFLMRVGYGVNGQPKVSIVKFSNSVITKR